MMQDRRPQEFNLEYIENELNKLEKALDNPLKIYVAGGFVMASNGLKAGTKDIDVVLENRTKLDTIVRRRFDILDSADQVSAQDKAW